MRTLFRMLAVGLTVAACHGHAAPSGSAAEDTDSADRWTVRETDGLCLLEQSIADFGAVRFVGAPDLPLRLEVLGNRQVFAAGPVNLLRVTPPWHPSYPERRELGAVEERVGSSLLAGEPLATRVLMALYDGYEAHLRHAAWYGGEADIRISNTHVRDHYAAFARCLRGTTADGWSSYQRTRIEYSSAAIDLTEQDRRRLQQVADYVLADRQVTAVFVDGHTDDVGPAQANLRVSRRRAEIVAGFLRQCGVPAERVVVRYHGDKYPVERPDDDAARARNRRTTVRLERAWPEVASADAAAAVD